MNNAVEFHHGMPDKLAYACRLLRKAYRSGAGVLVTGDVSTLKALDRQLWVFDEQEFLPHVLALPGQDMPERLHATPVWLAPHGADAKVPGQRSILVNLGPEMPDQPERFERLFEIVSREPHDRQLGRQRWKQYEALGLQIQPHEVTA
ncbi:DNA polymerase III subunit chi [Aquabacterium sp.]|uniref:DNA polymerase III subunit chi n=1 Tax=Aquabacterium sp. TaxID=1872578 RepID=UPI003D6D16EB